MIKNIIRVLISNFWVAAIGLIGSFVFPKLLTIDSYAEYQTFVLYISYLPILALGFPTGMVINYAGKSYYDMDKACYKTEVTLVFGILFGFTAIGLIVSAITGLSMILYVSLAILPTSMINSYKALCQAWNRFERYTKINMFIPTATTLVALAVYFFSHELTGSQYIGVYLVIYFLVFGIVFAEFFHDTHKSGYVKVFTAKNLSTLKSGFILMIGNYVNVLFHSIDQQFIKVFFDTRSFAMYSFGMSMQAIMTVFINSISQPLFPRMAQDDLKEDDYRKIKEMLFVFGSFSGCAFFACSFIVEHFITNYMDSLQVISIFFAVFPAMAVINCLYVNLYKVKRLTALYVRTLFGILIVAGLLNMAAVLVGGDYYAISIATTITYYVWLFAGGKHFPYLKVTRKDLGYLLLYLIVYFGTTNISNIYLGMTIYAIVMTILAFGFYKKSIFEYLRKCKRG